MGEIDPTNYNPLTFRDIDTNRFNRPSRDPANPPRNPLFDGSMFSNTGDEQHDVEGSPAIGPNGTIYVGCSDHHLYALNPNGTLKWNYDAGAEVWTCPAFGADGTVYFTANNARVYALDVNGQLKAGWPQVIGCR